MSARESFSIRAWNAHNALPGVLGRYALPRDGDLAIVLTEVWTRYDFLRAFATDRGMRLLMEKTGDRDREIVPEQGDTALLLAHGVKLIDWDVIPLEERWTVFTAGRVHEPRRPIRALVEHDGRTIELVAAHGPTGGNGAAVAEFKREVGRVLERSHDDVVSAAVGDLNFQLREARAWARDLGARVSGKGPDLIAVRGGVPSSQHGDRRTSDHYALTHRVAV